MSHLHGHESGTGMSAPRDERNAAGTVAADYESEHTIQASEGEEELAPERVRSNFDEDLIGYRFRRVASKTVVSFHPDDPTNPVNWGLFRKGHVLIAGMLAVFNTTFGSSLPSGAVPSIAKQYGVNSTIQQVLPVSLFMLGYVVGPLFCGPLSEAFGRRPLIAIPFMFFAIFTMACALTPNWDGLLVFRFFLGLAGASPNAVVGGLYADVFGDPKTRGRVMASYMAATCLGPVIAPIVSGYTSMTIGWRWTFWVGLCFNGFTAPFILTLPETYGPIILKRRAAKLRKKTGNSKIFSQFDVEDRRNAKKMITVTLTRPLRMIVRESIVLFTCLYLSLVYGIFYLFFQAYPLIFEDSYGLSTGKAGLMYLPIGGGVILAIFVFIGYDRVYARAQQRGESWVELEEYRRLPLACLGGPLCMIALFWLGWTSRPGVPWAVPMLSGIPFGMGFELIFMAMLNYLSDAYETFAASAQAIASCTRSVMAVVLPLAARPMFDRLGFDWGGSLLAFLCMLMSLIPFAFIKWGRRIRETSRFCIELKQLKEAERRMDEETSGRNGDETFNGDSVDDERDAINTTGILPTQRDEMQEKESPGVYDLEKGRGHFGP